MHVSHETCKKIIFTEELHMSKQKVHLICNAHIDPIWQWDWQEGASAVLSTFRSAVNLAEKYDYIFCHNEVTVYKYVEEYAPDLFEKIRQLVKEGKWHITGGWYLQPDDNMPMGESFVRQIQMGFDYFREKFGVTPTTAFNVDAFGHTRGLVQILKKCGQDSLIVCRPHTNEQILEENLFVWKGFDGSEIKVYRSPNGYSSPLGATANEIINRLNRRTDEPVTCIMWGVGNHGGGPSDQDLSDIAKLMQNDTDHEMFHSTPEAFFADVQPTYTVDQSLHISMPGCYTSSICVKQKHLELENELYLAEIMSSVANLKGVMPYPKDALYGCFIDLLNGEFHDVLPGSSIQAGEHNGMMLFHHGMLDAEKIKTKAFFALCQEQPVAKEGEYPILVFNPHPYTLKTNVECEFSLADQNWSSTEVSKLIVTDGETPVTHQVIKEESNLNLDWRKRVIFEAELPPMHLKRYSIYVEKQPVSEIAMTDSIIFDNGRKYVEIDKQTGLLKSYRLNGKEYVKDAFSLMMFDDNPDPWAMQKPQLKRLGTNGQPFVLSKTPHGVFNGMNSIQIIEDGDIYLGVEAFFEKDNSKARIEYRIYKNNDDVDVNITLFFQDMNKMVKVAVPVCHASDVIGQTAFGTDKLFTDGRENVSQRFTAVRSGDKYAAIFDRSRYGSHFEDDTLYLSLVRGTTYCAHPIQTRPLIPLNRFTKKMDQSEHNYAFRLSICEECELDRKALEFNRRPFAVNVFPLNETATETPFEIQVSNPNITLAAMKKSDRRAGYLIRLMNNYKEPQSTMLTVGTSSEQFHFGMYEVKTIYYDNSLQELTMLEI